MKGKPENIPEYSSFNRGNYDLCPELSFEEKAALSNRHMRSRSYGSSGPLSSLISPLIDIASTSGASPRIARIVIMAMLAEMADAGQPCWQWHQDRWITFFKKYRDGKPLMMAFAYHLGPFTSPLQIPHDRMYSLYASAIYGSTQFSCQLNILAETLITLGYAKQNQRSKLSHSLGLLMLLNNTAELENMTTELLWQAQQYDDEHVARQVGKISHGLAALGIISTPLRMRNYTEWFEKSVDGISSEWAAWCRRWRETSVLRPVSRETQYSFILRCGLWLAREHPDVKKSNGLVS